MGLNLGCYSALSDCRRGARRRLRHDVAGGEVDLVESEDNSFREDKAWCKSFGNDLKGCKIPCAAAKVFRE